MSELVGRDMGSTTRKNIAMLERETGLNLCSDLPVKFIIICKRLALAHTFHSLLA